MLTVHDRDLALLNALRAERAAAAERERIERLAEARCWEEYLFTALDQLTARLHRATPSAPQRREAA